MLDRSKMTGVPNCIDDKRRDVKVSVFHRESSREEFQISQKETNAVIITIGSKDLFVSEVVKECCYCWCLNN